MAGVPHKMGPPIPSVGKGELPGCWPGPNAEGYKCRSPEGEFYWQVTAPGTGKGKGYDKAREAGLRDGPYTSGAEHNASSRGASSWQAAPPEESATMPWTRPMSHKRPGNRWFDTVTHNNDGDVMVEGSKRWVMTLYVISKEDIDDSRIILNKHFLDKADVSSSYLGCPAKQLNSGDDQNEVATQAMLEACGVSVEPDQWQEPVDQDMKNFRKDNDLLIWRYATASRPASGQCGLFQVMHAPTCPEGVDNEVHFISLRKAVLHMPMLLQGQIQHMCQLVHRQMFPDSAAAGRSAMVDL